MVTTHGKSSGMNRKSTLMLTTEIIALRYEVTLPGRIAVFGLLI